MARAQSNTFPTSGNVGIGTVAPVSRLQVHSGFSTDCNTYSGQPALSLRWTIAQLALFATHADLLALEDIVINDRAGLELGMEYPELQSNIPTLTFMRYFILGNQFLCFSITGSKDDLPRFLDHKEAFFDAINFD